MRSRVWKRELGPGKAQVVVVLLLFSGCGLGDGEGEGVREDMVLGRREMQGADGREGGDQVGAVGGRAGGRAGGLAGWRVGGWWAGLRPSSSSATTTCVKCVQLPRPQTASL